MTSVSLFFLLGAALLASTRAQYYGCNKLDIAFLVDASSNVRGRGDWERAQQFATTVIAAMSGQQVDVKFAMAYYSDRADVLFDFNTYASELRLVNAVENSVGIYNQGTADLVQGLDLVRDRLLSSTANRRDAADLVIIITSGTNINKQSLAASRVSELTRLGITVVSASLRPDMPIRTLQAIASEERYAIIARDLQLLATILPSTLSISCPTSVVAQSANANCGVADIVFVVDSSGSINDDDPGNWRLVLRFLSDVTRQLMKLGSMRFGTVVFSNQAKTVLKFTGYSDTNDLLSKLGSIQYIGGRTNLADGLEEARTQVLSPSEVRPGAFKIIILMTDGKPNERSGDTLIEAQRAKDERIRIIPIGVTNAIDIDLLRLVANNPNDVITTPDFNSLTSQVANIVSLACGTPTPAPPVTGCTGKADITFIIDSSGSIKQGNPADWDRVIAFLQDAIRGLYAISSDMRFGIVTFSYEARLVFDFNRFSNVNDVIAAVRTIPYIGSTTDIADGFEMARTQILVDRRPDAAQIVILMTDGKPNSRVGDTEPEAQRVKDLGARVVAIGVTMSIDEPQLRRIASTPNDVILTIDFATLAGQVNDIIGVACSGTRPPPPPVVTPRPPGDCRTADIIFIIDSSGSIKQTNPGDWDLVLNFLRQAIRNLAQFSNDIRFGIVTFSYEARLVFDLNAFQNVNDVVNAVSTIPYIGSTTNMADGFEVARTRILGDARPGAEVVVILMTDGKPNSRVSETEPQADLIKRQGARLIAIGVTDLVDLPQLERVASTPNDVISTPDFASLADKVNDIVGRACLQNPVPQPTPRPTFAPVTPGDCGKADIMFLVDSSGSIKETNPADWDFVLGFLRDAISGLGRISNDIRFSIVTFSFEARLVFDLNRYTNVNDVIDAVASIPYIGSTTDIYDGLNVVRTQVLPGIRPDAAKILILMTDGKPNEQVPLTEPEADRVKAAGVRIVGIGVTAFIDEDQLRRIATTPNDVITTPDFASLAGRVNDIIGVACAAPIVTPRPQPPPTGGCGKADIVFIVDSSGSIKATDPRDWDLVLNFLRDAIRRISGFGNDVRFAIVSFSYEARIVFTLTRYTNVNDVVNAVSDIPYINSITNIADGFEVTRTGILNEARPDAARIVILMTDGKPNSRESETEPQADLLKGTGARIITIGVTKLVDVDQLRRMASSPNDVITTPDFATLAAQVGDIVGVACGPVPPPTFAPTPIPTQDCGIADVIFLVDSSGSIKQGNLADWDLTLDFLRDTIRGLARISTDIRFGIVTFSYEARMVFDLNEYVNVNDVISGVSRIPYIGSTTNIADAFKMAREQVLPTSRPAAGKIIILMTDGMPNVEVPDTEPEAQRVKSAGVRVVAIGVTDNVDQAQLERIASSPRDALSSPDFASLSSRVSDLVTAACPSPVVTPRPTPRPTPQPPRPTPGACNVVDVALIVDSSGSIQEKGPNNWNLLVAFVQDLVRNIASLGDARFGLVDFSDNGQLVFNLNDFQDTNAVITAVDGMPYFGGRTNIAEALQIVRDSIVPQSRPTANMIVILVTDGIPNERLADTIPEAERLKSTGSKIVTVGVTSDIDEALLQQIASSRSESLTSPDFTSLANQVGDVVGTACVTLPPIEPCGVVDIILIVDTSGSIQERDAGNWDLVLNFLRDLINTIGSGSADTRFAIVSFSDNAELVFDLNRYGSYREALDGVAGIPYRGGRTNIADALGLARSRVLPQARADAIKLAILVTDGIPNEKEMQTLPEASMLKAMARVMSVGVTDQIDEDLLINIATSRQDVILSPDFSFLSGRVSSVISRACATAPPTPAPDACNSADFIFIVDSSGSIQERDPTNWNLVLSFVKDTLTAIDRVATDVRIGLIDFSQGAYVVFDMMAYEARATNDLIDNMVYFGGTTNIAEALQLARESLLPQMRSGSIKIAIMLTDGKPNERESDTIPQANLLKNEGVRIITLGITDEVDPQLLQNVASSTRDALLSPDFATLSSLVTSLLSSACVVLPDPPTPPPVTCNVADIALIVDSSGSIQERDPGNWNLVLQFLETVVRDIMRGRDVRFGLVDFSNSAYVVFNFNQFSAVNEIITNIRSMTYFGGTTNIAEGLQLARENLFTNVRPGAVGIAILLTDGKPNERVDDTLPEAFSLKGIGVRIVPVGVTDEIDLALLENIANNPRDVITSTDFNTLSSQINNIIGVACGPGTPAPQFCTGSDVVLAIDSSGSIEENGGEGNWEKVLILLEDILNTIANEGDDVNFGMVEFSGNGRLIFNLQPRPLNEVVRLTRAMPYLGATTNIADALEIAREQIFPTSARPNSAKMLILMTDGKPNERETDTIPQATLLKDTGVRVVSIGVTNAVDQNLLREISSSPDDVFLSPNFESLSQEIRELVRVLCLGASRNSNSLN